MTRKEIEAQLGRIEKMKAEYEKLVALENDLKSALKNADEIPVTPMFNDQEPVFYVNDDLDVTRYAFLADPPTGILPFNRFHTREGALEFSDMCKWNAMLLHCRHYLCPDYKPDWETKEVKYTVFLSNINHEAPRFVVDRKGNSISNFNCVYFPSIDLAQKSANWMNKHWGYGG